jgi:hypothetical protein
MLVFVDIAVMASNEIVGFRIGDATGRQFPKDQLPGCSAKGQ